MPLKQFRKLWRLVAGNAVWDAIKWLVPVGGAVVTWIFTWIREWPILVQIAFALAAGVIGSVVVAAGIGLWQSRQNKPAPTTHPVPISAQCGTPRSEKRNVPYGPAHDRQEVDFLGIEIRNGDNTAVQNVRASLVEIKRPNGTAWQGNASLDFSPVNSTTALIEISSLRKDVPETAWLMTLVRTGVPKFSLFERNWTDPKEFQNHLIDPGEYVFKILLSGDGMSTQTISVLLQWNWTRQTATLRIKQPAGNSNPS